jgi:beta-lactamase superfamily II metal-dependent hydrolase
VFGFLEAKYFPLERSHYLRMDLAFDSIDVDRFERHVANNRQAEDLSIVRVMTTRRRFAEKFSLGEDIEEGWYRLELSTSPDSPPAWQVSAAGNYLGPIQRTNVVAIEPVSGALRTALRSGSRVSVSRSPQTSRVALPPADFHVRVVDVGHASFSAVHATRDTQGKIVGYFDVGGPVFFHKATFPKSFREGERVPRSGFVVLSHWDFDHYSLAVSKLVELQELHWYAPRQEVGFNAARLQANLSSRLKFIAARRVDIGPSLQLFRGLGTRTNRNDSGYVMLVKSGRGPVLLTGDVSYEKIPMRAKRGLVGICIPHHGGNGSENPPTSATRATAAVSYGLPNRYHHPNEANLKQHASPHWHVERTAGSPTRLRGDIWLP